MNTAHWHLTLNHLPIIGILIGTLILIAGYIFKNNPEIKRIALGVFVFAALCAIPAYLTGEGAEEMVEKIPGVTKDVIEKHEDLGKTFFILTSVLGVLSLITFFANWKKLKSAPSLYLLVLTTAIGISIFAQQLGTSGGEIRHTEIRGSDQQQDIIQPGTGDDNDD